MARYNYQISSIPAVPRSQKLRERNSSASSTSYYGGGGGGALDLTEYVKWSDILKTDDTVQKEYLDTNIMSSLLVKNLLDAHDHANKLIRPAVLCVPTSPPDNEQFVIGNNEVAFYFTEDGSYAESGGGGGVADVYKLTLMRNNVQIGVFDAGAADATINISVPTKVSDLANDSLFVTQNYVESNYLNKSYLYGDLFAGIFDGLIDQYDDYILDYLLPFNYNRLHINGFFDPLEDAWTEAIENALDYANPIVDVQVHNSSIDFVGYDTSVIESISFATICANYVPLSTLASYYTSIQTDSAIATAIGALNIPSKLSDLTNDMISSWALASSKPSYSYSEISGAPSKLSDLTDDIVSGYYLSITGGTLTGVLNSRHIYPSQDVTYNLGSKSARWGVIYANSLLLSRAGATSLQLPNTGRIVWQDSNDVGRIVMTFSASNQLLLGSGLEGVGSMLVRAGSSFSLQVYNANNSTRTTAVSIDNVGTITNLGSLNPRADNTYLLGGANLAWKSAYIYDIIAKTSITTPLATITTNSVTNEIVSGSLAIPAVAPTNPDSNKVYLYFTENGSYAESGGSGGVADVYKLTLKRNNVQIGVFEAGVADATINISVPTKVSDLTNDLGFITLSGVEAICANYVPLSTLANYYTSIQTDSAIATAIGALNIPSKLSDLTNDMISSWALASTKPSYSYSEISGAPSKLSDLTDDIVSGSYLPLIGGTLTGSLIIALAGTGQGALVLRSGHSRGATLSLQSTNNNTTVTTSQWMKTTQGVGLTNNVAGCSFIIGNDGELWLSTSAQATTKDYEVYNTGNLVNVSQLNNDAGYLTQHQSLANYVTLSDLTTTLADYVTSNALTTALANYVTSSALTTSLANYLPLAGGTMTGNILLGTDVTYNIGSATSGLNYLYTKIIRMPNGGKLQAKTSGGSWGDILMTNSNDQVIYGGTTWSVIYRGSTLKFQTYNNGAYVDSMIIAADGSISKLHNMISNTKNTYNLGSTANYWLNAYIQNVIAGTSITSPSATITTNNVTNEVVSGSLAIPAVAPTNPDSNKVYLYFTEDGNYAE